MSRCSKGHFSMYQLHHKFSILSGGARLKRWPGSQPRSSTNRGAVFPPQNPTHPRFGISALESELLVHEVSVGLLAGLPVFSSPPQEICIKSPSGLISILRERSHFCSLEGCTPCLAGPFPPSLSHPPHQHSSMKTGCHQAQLLIHNRSAMCDCL